jgi:diamine N-acetyltransferase
MPIDLRLSKDAELAARLNESVQRLHFERYPGYFKPYSFEEARAFMARQMAEEGWSCLVASSGGEDLGYALFFIRNYAENPFRKAYKGVHVDQICVAPGHRGEGVGAALMDGIEAFARSEGASQLELTYWEANVEAAGFYAHRGFETNFRFVARRLD